MLILMLVLLILRDSHVSLNGCNFRCRLLENFDVLCDIKKAKFTLYDVTYQAVYMSILDQQEWDIAPQFGVHVFPIRCIMFSTSSCRLLWSVCHNSSCTAKSAWRARKITLAQCTDENLLPAV